ncbi:MAG TPA: hypothetical protein VFU21_13625 [Kofleriaceae bacterium]|nr:hypothetical protein [Kofleriaceae bacterium]
MRFAVGTDREKVLEPQAGARRGGSDLPDLFDPSDVDGAPTEFDVSVRIMPLRPRGDATRLTPVNEEKIWARSLQQAKERMGKSTGATPPPIRTRAPRGTPPIRMEAPARLDRPARTDRPPPIDAMPTTRVPAPPPLAPPPLPPPPVIERHDPHPPAQVIDLAAARRQRDASITGMPLKAAAPPPPPAAHPAAPPSIPVPVSVGPAPGPAAATGVASAMGAAPGLAAASAAPQPFWNPDLAPSPSPAPAPAALPYQPASQYAVYEQIGLGAPASVAPRQKATQAVVSAYRGIGFAILTIIVVVLVGYITTSVFYMVSDSWIEPMVVSPTDERVLALRSQLAEKSNLRDQVALELQHTERYIASQQEFQAEFVKAVKADLAERKTTLRRLRALASGYAGERTRIRRSNREFAKQSKAQMHKEYAARLIDRSEYLQGAYQLGQIATSNLSLAERQVEFETRAAEIDGEARALEAMLSQKQAEAGGDGTLSYEVLKVKQEYDQSRLDTQKAIESRAALKDSLARYDAILTSIKRSPWLRAADHTADVAFVPYANLDEVKVGSSVYACGLEMVFCYQVGKVRELLPGEVTFKHPFREKDLRGQMVELDLDDDEKEAVAKSVLFVGGRPMLF